MIIRGNTVGAAPVQTNYSQTDVNAADYLKNREIIADAVDRANSAVSTTDMEEALGAMIGIANSTLAVSGWTGSGPYKQTVSVTGVTADKPPHVSPVYSGSNDAALEAACACITYATAGNGTITFVCLHDKPAVAIPIQVEVHK